LVLAAHPDARIHPNFTMIQIQHLKRAGAMSGLTLSTSLPDQANFREEKE
jgi:hypothetical protein